MGHCIPEHLRATRAVMNLSRHAATWFRCTGINPGTITWEQLSFKLRQSFVLLILISGHVTGWNNAPRQQALRPTRWPSDNDCWSAIMLVIKKQYEDISLD